MNTNKLLDAYKAHHGIESDYALAARLHVTRSTVNAWRKRGLPERLAFHFATEIHLDAAEVLAAVRADHATDAAIKKTWEKIARTMHHRAAVLLLALLPVLFFSAPNDARASLFESTNNIHYANFRRRVARVFAYFLGKTRSALGHFFDKIPAAMARVLHHPQQLKLL